MNSLENGARTFRFSPSHSAAAFIESQVFGKLRFLDFLQRVFRNFDPHLRSQEKAVEYVRALNAAKLDKVALSSDIRVL